MKNLHRTLMMLSLASLLALPMAASAVDVDPTQSVDRRSDRGGSRSDRGGSRSDRGGSRSDRGGSRSDSSSGRSTSSRSHRSDTFRDTRGDRYGHGSGGRVVVTQPTVVYRPRVVVSAPRVVVRTNPRYIEPMYLSRAGFDDVMWQLDRARFESERLDIIYSVASRYSVSTYEARAMVATLRFSDSRVDALAALHRRVRDRDNWFSVYDLLSFSHDRAALRARCGS